MSNIPIFLSSDNNYAPFVSTTIASICDNTKSFCDVYVLDGGITKENQNKICELKNQFNNFSIEFINLKDNNELKSIKYQNPCEYITLSAYNRFLIPRLKPDLQKILYLDVDMIVMCDIQNLFDIDLENYAIGAIPEIKSEYKGAIERVSTLKLNKNHKYFNSGVLVIDTQKWIKENIVELLFKTERERNSDLFWGDQDVLNIVFDNNYKEIAYSYNYMTDSNNVNEEIYIRHFNRVLKPWNIHPDVIKANLIKNVDIFWKYAEMTSFYNELLEKCKFKTMQDVNKYRLEFILKHRNAK